MPSDRGIPGSDFIKGIEWIGERIGYPEGDVKGDTFPMTWAVDGDIYTSSGDPLWGETTSGLDVEKFQGDPRNYRIVKVHHMNDYAGLGGDGPKPTGMTCVEGILYLAFQNLLRNRKAPISMLSQHGSDAHIDPRNASGLVRQCEAGTTGTSRRSGIRRTARWQAKSPRSAWTCA